MQILEGQKVKKLKVLSVLFPAACLMYHELLFGFSVFGMEFLRSIPTVLLSALIMGSALGLLMSLLSGKAWHTVNIIVSIILPLPFVIEFFINMQFKTVYDVNTVLNGGSDALGGFAGTIASLLLSVSGLVHLLLFFLPAIIAVAYAVKTGFRMMPVPVKLQLALGVVFTAALIADAVIVNVVPALHNAYKTEYSFQNAARRFGLYETVALDITHNNSDGEVIFVTAPEVSDVVPTATPTPEVTVSPVPAEPDATPAPTPSPTPVPLPQIMDIDFDQVAQDTSGTMSSLAEYCAGLEPSMTNEYTGIFEGKNLVMITAEAFTAEVIDPDLTPTLYRLAYNGINFNDFYVPATAGTTGGEFSHIFGLLPTSGGSSVPHMTSHGNTGLIMSEQLSDLGYYGMAFHNNDYAYYSRNTTHNEMGYSEGYMGWGNGLESYVDPVWPESDLQMFEATVDMYIDHQPFNAYYMTVSGHSNYSYGANAQARAHWDETEFMADTSTERVRSYIAANLEVEYALEYLVGRLEEEGIEDDTVICLVADHYPYGLDRNANPGHMPYLSELYGYEVTNYIERDHNRAILWCGSLEASDPIIVDSPASSIDLLPTLLNLFGLEWDSRLLPGRDVLSDAMPLYFNANYDWKTDLGTYISSRGTFIPASDDTDIPEGYVDYIRSIVSNKMTFNRGVMSVDFYNYLLGDGE